MKIVHFARLYFPHIGGVETHVREISKECVQAGHEVTVITEQYDPTLPLTEIIDDIQIIRIPNTALHSKLETWKAVWSLRLEWQAADVIQVHDVFWWVFPFVLSTKQKFFMTFHGWEGSYPLRWQAKAQRWLANKLAVKSIHVGDWIREFYWDAPDAVTYGGVNEPQTTEKKSAPRTKIVFLGRLSADNDLELYLDVLNILKLQNKNDVLWIGDGEMRAECEKFGKVTGFIKNPTYYLQNADIVFASSYLSILEAQSLGKAVMAMHSNPLKKRYLETHPGASAMIIGSDPSNVALQVKELHTNKNTYNQLSKTAAAFAKLQSWKKVTAIYLSLWQTIK